MRPCGANSRDGAPNPSAWDWEELFRFVHLYARSRTQSPTVAEDVAQDVLLDLARKASVVQYPRAWAAAAVRRALKKAEYSVGAAFTADLDDTIPATVENPTVRVLCREVLDSLAEGHLLVLQLAVAGLLQKQIADVLGCETSEVGPRLARAHRAARKIAAS